jgi:nucleoside-triphosphatase THEP1/SAM-dependent methyltransferase
MLRSVLAARSRGERALLVTGGIGAGKTAAVLALADGMRRQGLRVGGVASPRILAESETVGYRVRDLSTGEEQALCSLTPPGIPFRRFFFSPTGLAFANRVLERSAPEAEVVVVDEVGPLELSGNGFAPGIRAALRSPAFLVLTVRPSLVSEVRRWADLPTAAVLSLDLPRLRSLDETRQLFDGSASDYGSWGGDDGPLTGYAESLAQAAALVRVGPGERLLDIGIGTGAFASRIARPDTEVWGVDLSPAMLAQCQETHPRFHLCEGHFLALPVPDRTFTVVASSFAFHHLAPAEYGPAFAEIVRVLAPGGRFVLLDIMFSSDEDREGARIALGDSWDDGEIYPLVPAVAQAADRAGAAGVLSHRVSWLHWAVTGARPR